MPPNVRFTDLCSILDFAYLGQANVPHDRLNDFLKVGEFFQVRGIKEGRIHFMTNQPQQYAQTATTAQVLNPVIVTQASFDPSVTSSQEEPRPAKRAREEEDEDNISMQEASEIMKLLLDNPEFDQSIKSDVSIKNENVVANVAPQTIQSQTIIHQEILPAVASNNKPKFLCRFCGRQLSTKGRVTKHEKECNDNPNREIIYCEVCQVELKPSSMNHHMNSKHGAKNKGKSPRHPTTQDAIICSTSTSPTTPTATTVSMHLPSPDGNHVAEKSQDQSEVQPKIEQIEEPKIIEKTEEVQISVD